MPEDGPGAGEEPAALTRRDAVAALTAAGAASVLGGTLTWAALTTDDADPPTGFTAHERATLVALAETLYPSAVSGVPAFVERYTVGRVRERPDYVEGMRGAIDALDDHATEWFDAPFADLDAETRGDVLGSMGVRTASPEPDGLGPERVRFYLVNELLFALYTTPTGGELVGIENPQGHPGGTTSYRRDPRE